MHLFPPLIIVSVQRYFYPKKKEKETPKKKKKKGEEGFKKHNKTMSQEYLLAVTDYGTNTKMKQQLNSENALLSIKFLPFNHW